MIRIGCCSFIFGGMGLEDSLRLCSLLGFRSVDVSAADIGPKAHVDQQEAAAKPEEQARRVRALADKYELELEEVFLCPVFVEGKRVEVSHPDAAVRASLLDRFRRLIVFAETAGFRSLMAVPGTPQKNLSPEQAWANACGTLREMVKIAADRGVRLNVEPHTGSLIEQPQAALRMAEETPGLTFTLDYAHFAARAIPQEQVYPLHRYTRHMHARQAKAGAGGCAVTEGTIRFEAILAQLRAADWDGVIAMEYFGGVGAKPWEEHAVIQNAALAHQLASLSPRPGLSPGCDAVKADGEAGKRGPCARP
jgi:sugar phosphate isomerase/epimerase